MAKGERLNWEIRDSKGNIVAATVDYGVAEAIQTLIPRTEIFECAFHATHKAWFCCDFSSYFDEDNPKAQVVIEGSTYTAKKVDIEVKEVM